MAETWKQWEGTIVDGKFRLEKFLGGSDHSAVFLTEAGTPTAKAAVKFVPATPQALEFQRAIWGQTSRLSHPHLIRLFGSGQCRLGSLDLVYVVTEYAEENLAQVLSDRALSAEETRDMLGPVLETLKYLHGNKLAHGSLKPSNILAVQDQLKLSSDQVHGFGKPGLASDASAFAAPELASKGADAGTDVWSLGVTLVEVLTQRVPERISPRQLVVPTKLPEPFRGIAGQCLMEPLQDRWSVAQIAERLADSPSSAAPVEPPSARVPAASSPTAPSKRVAASRAAVAPETIREHTPLELGSSRKLMVSGISFLLVLVAIYGGSQLFHRGSHDNAAASAPEATNPSEPAASDHSTAAPSSAVRKGDASRSAAAGSPVATSATPSTSVSSSPGRVLGRVEPDVSASSRATITGKIHVRVGLRVDPSGKVVEARLISPGPSKYFAGHALEAARRWTFVPPQAEGQPTISNWTLIFTFTRKGVDSSAQAD
jgi:TonB family protein